MSASAFVVLKMIIIILFFFLMSVFCDNELIDQNNNVWFDQSDAFLEVVKIY